MIKVKNRAKRKFITSVFGFESLNLNVEHFVGPLKTRINSGCAIQLCHNGVELVFQGNFWKEMVRTKWKNR
jgi:translation initiation factor 1 (eIF-1/SUI1)